MNATLEKPVSAAVAPETDLGAAALAEFSEKKAALAAMRAEFTGLDCATRENRDRTHAAIMRLTKVRTGTDKRADELMDGAKQWIGKVKLTRDEIIATAQEIEKPLREKRDAFDAAEEAKRQAKINAERERLAAIERQRLADEAARVKAAQDAENERLRLENERLTAERAKLQKLRDAVAAEQKRIDDERAADEARKAADKAKADAKAEQDRLEAKRQADKLQADKDKLEADRLAFEAQKQAEKDAAEKAERDRLAAIEAKRIKAEHEAWKAEEAAKVAEAKAAAMERMRPDVEKMAKFAGMIEKLIEKAPVPTTDDGVGKMNRTFAELRSIIDGLKKWGTTQ